MFKKISNINSKTCLLIILISFFFLYFSQSLIMNESIDTIAAFEIDASLMVDSVFQHLRTYNLQEGYMSKFYGWSYFSINYVILKPLTILENILSINNTSFNIFLVKEIYFLISLSSCFALYFLIKKIFNENVIALVGSLLYVFAPLKTEFFTDIKPETTGLLFLFLSQLFLINFIQSNRKKMLFWYTFGIIFLTLSILAKQSFIFLVLPTIITFYCYYIEKEKLKFWGNLFSKNTLKIVLFSIFIVLAITLIVYPHLFIHPIVFINNINRLLIDHGSNGTYVLRGKVLLTTWLSTIWNNPFLRTIVLIYPIAIMSLIKNKILLKKFFLINLLILPILIYFVCKNSALFISPRYLAPFFSIFIIIFLLPLSKIFYIENKLVKYFFLILYFFVFVLLISFQFFNINTSLEIRKKYKQTDVYDVYNYILNEIPSSNKLAISNNVLIPNKDGKPIYESCSWWQNCSIRSYLDKYEPDYFIFSKDIKYNGIQPEHYLNYTNYIKENNFQYQKTIGNFLIYKKQ